MCEKQSTVLVIYNYNIDLETRTLLKIPTSKYPLINNSNHSYLYFSMHLNKIDGKKHEKLCYSGQKCEKIPEAIVKLYGTKVQSLDLSYNELHTLRGLEGFPLLKELVLDNNQLTDSIVLPYLPYLHTLSLNKNNIDDLEVLLIKINHNLPMLNYLSLLGNKACPNKLSNLDSDEEDYQRYRHYVLYHLPSLKFLDSSKVTDMERKEARRTGQFMKIIRPKTCEVKESKEEKEDPFTPLPKNIRRPEDFKGVYGKCRFRYSGKHSEGNRFISNNDL